MKILATKRETIFSNGFALTVDPISIKTDPKKNRIAPNRNTVGPPTQIRAILLNAITVSTNMYKFKIAKSPTDNFNNTREVLTLFFLSLITVIIVPNNNTPIITVEMIEINATPSVL